MTRHKKATQRRRLLVAAALGAVVVGIAGFAWAQGAREGEPNRSAVEVGATPSATPSAAPDPEPDEPEADEPEPPSLSLSAAPTAAALTVTELRGTASGLSPGASLVVEHQQPDGSWKPFPLPTVVDAGGSFRTYVELGRRGPNRIRVRERASGVTSEPVTITVR